VQRTLVGGGGRRGRRIDIVAHGRILGCRVGDPFALL
jgi:hypothetical protein